MADNTIKIGGELESMATGKIVAAASAIKDKSRNKTQEVINGDVEQAIAEQSAQFEALSEETSAAVASSSQSARKAKQYLEDLQEAITELPDGQAVSAQVAVNEVDIAGLKSDVVVDLSTRYATSYANLSAALTALNSDTATDAAAIKKAGVSIKFINSTTNKYEQWNLKASSWSTNTSDWALDADGSVTNGKLKLPFELEKPSANEYVTQASEIGYGDIPAACGLIYDISVAHAVGNVPAQYESLSAALGTNGANIPQNIRRGGMNIKFIQSSDNKYVQYRCISNVFSTNVKDWEGKDIEVENDTVIDFSIKDERNYDIVKFSGGHIKTKKFDSSVNSMSSAEKSKLAGIEEGAEVNDVETTSITSDLEISDENGNVLVRFNDGYIKTKNFDSKNAATKAPATSSSDGLMSSSDKQKLDSLNPESNVDIQDLTGADLEISDEDGNAIMRLKGGHVKTKNFDSKDIEKRVSALEGNSGSKIILTVGDSLTEGAGANKNYKGEILSTYYNYTSWMQTKTADYVFSMHGIGGEKSAAILGRMFGAPLVVGEKFTLPANTSPVQVNLVSSWYDRTNEDRRSHNLGGATGTVRDTNPCVVNGIPVTLSLSSGTYYIQRNTAAAESVDILADTPIIPNNYNTYKDNTYCLVFWCGTNDIGYAEFTDELIEHIRKTAEIYNTKKYVVVGMHYIAGSTTLAMRKRQEIQFQDAFGDKFINWREYVSNFAIRDAISRGYIEDTGVYPTAADITAMNEGNIPPTLLVDTVHLCQEGYMLVGDLIYERLVSLGYIN